MAASQAQATSASTATAAPSLPAEHFLKEAEREVTKYRAASGLAMEVAQESGKILYPDPLDWWRIKSVSTIGGGRGYEDSVPVEVTKTTPSGDRTA